MADLTRILRVLRRKCLKAIPTVIAIVIINFLLLQLAPGDVADVVAGESGAATAESMAAFRRYFRLDLPLIERLWDYLYNLAHFADRGLVKPPFFVQSVFGLLGGIGSHPEDVAHMKRTADRLFGDKFRWSVLGAGAAQLRVAAQSAALGGNIRVGLEDSLWAGKGKLAKSNAEQVLLARKIIEGLGMEVATPDEARQILELKGGDKVAF